MEKFTSMKQVARFRPDASKRLHSATHEEIVAGATTDIYFVKTAELLEKVDKSDVVVTAEIFSRGHGIACGTEECLQLLKDVPADVYALPEGEEFFEKDVLMRLEGRYSEFGIYETALLGILASSCGWATAAHECRQAAGEKPFLCFGARHVHPAVAPVMERAAVVGGASGASCILGARLAGIEPSGTVPHSVFLIVGDTVDVAKIYHNIMPAGAARIVLVDTFRDEAEEALRVANALGEHLEGIRLDTPSERGGVTVGLVREVRARLDQAGFGHVKILATGGLNPARIIELSNAGVDSFGVGSYISGATPIDMTMDLKIVAGHPVAKRGRIPGITPSGKLVRMQ